MPRTQTDIATIAAALRDAKEQHKPVTLLLGSRAGVFSSEDCLYKALAQRIVPTSNSSSLLKHLAPSDESALHLLEPQLHMLKTLSSPDKFKACYTILKQLSEGGIYTILTDALAQVRYREEDELLAGLIKAHFFDVIITTNIDTLLEDACEALWNMRSPNDYQVIRCGIEKSEEIERGKPTYGQVIKLFGDLNSLTYKAGNNEFVLDADQTLKKILQAKLSEEILVIGYDPIWDQPVERAFQETGKRVWYINEEVLSPDTYLAQVLAQRGGGDLVEDQGRYDNFVKELSHYLGSGTSELTQVMPPLPLPQPQEQRKNRVFVSCSPENREQLERLQTQLKDYVYESENLLKYSDDTQIPSSAAWEKEMKEVLKSAKVAVLLVSADFLASDFILEYELPPLLKAAQAGKIEILPVLLGPCAFARTPLSHYQAVNNVAQPLMRMTQDEQDMVWAKLAELVYENLRS